MNSAKLSLVYDRAVDYGKYLGSVQRNDSGHVVGMRRFLSILKISQQNNIILFYNLLGAKATFIRFFGQVNKTAIALGDRAALAKVDFIYGYY